MEFRWRTRYPLPERTTVWLRRYRWLYAGLVLLQGYALSGTLRDSEASGWQTGLHAATTGMMLLLGVGCFVVLHRDAKARRRS